MSKPKLPTEEKALPEFPYWAATPKGSFRPRYISVDEMNEIGTAIAETEVADQTEKAANVGLDPQG